MTAAVWIASSLLVIVVTLVVFGAAVRPYVAQILVDSKEWQRRAEAAEAEIEAHMATEVRLIPPIDPQADLDVFLKGIGD